MGFNMLAQGAQRYGKHPWHWYGSRAAPFILGSLGLPLLPALLDVLRGGAATPAARNCRRLLLCAALVVGLYSTQVILPTAPAVSNEGGSSPLLALVPAVSWPWVSAWGSLEPPCRDGENAQKTGKKRGKNGRDTA